MQAVNPFLPSWEYIPDGEPHVFDGRIYLFGSHDRFDGDGYCMNDYVCYSADTKNLKEWRYEGVIYRKNQDPRNQEGGHCMWAPDVAKGLDGRYYLYYCLDVLQSAMRRRGLMNLWDWFIIRMEHLWEERREIISSSIPVF